MIVWLEDRRSTVLDFERALEEAGLRYLILGSVDEVATYLDDGAEIDNLVFVVDIMLPGVADLTSIGVQNAPTGKGNRAGQVFVERYLRQPSSAYLACPVFFLTERLVDDELRNEVKGIERPGTAPVKIFQKYSQAELGAFVHAVRDATKAPATAKPLTRRRS